MASTGVGDAMSPFSNTASGFPPLGGGSGSGTGMPMDGMAVAGDLPPPRNSIGSSSGRAKMARRCGWHFVVLFVFPCLVVVVVVVDGDDDDDDDDDDVVVVAAAVD